MSESPTTAVIYHFGPFQLDAQERTLYRDGQTVNLAPKVAETLVALVESNGKLVTKEQLMHRLWPDSYVEESNLTQNVFLLRKALGDAGEYIQTVPRRGYRFRAEVRRSQTDGAVDELIFTSTRRTRIVREETTEEESETPEPRPEAWPAKRTDPSLLVVPRPSRARLPIILAAATLLVLVGGFGMIRLRSESWKNLFSKTHQAERPKGAQVAAELKRLTYDSKAFDPVISPDGHSVAYKYLDGDRNSIILRDIANGSTVEVLPPTAHDEYANLAFSPDGSYVYVRKNATIMRVPVFGGTTQQLVSDVWSSFALSPDGRQVAFIRGYNSGQEMRLLVADMEGGERELARSNHGDLWFAIWGSGPAWSPDGQKIVLIAGSKETGGYYNYLLEVQVSDGLAKKVPGARWLSASQEAWLPDGTGLVVSAQERLGAPYQLWLVAYPSGEMRRLTNDLIDYDKISISPDSRLLVAQQERNVSHVWVMSIGDEAGARQLTSGTNDADGVNGLAWTPDGRILFGSTRAGAYNIWTIKADGADERQITFDPGGTNWGPRTTPDGRYIVFVSYRAGRNNVWRMDSDGSNPVRLTSGEGEFSPQVSPDGRWVYYTNFAGSYSVIERISVYGGEKQTVLGESDARYAVISPDGTLIAYDHFDDANGWQTAVVPADGSGSPRLLGFHPYRGIVRWTADSRSLVYIDARHLGKIWRQPIAGGAPRPFAQFATESISSFDLSPDGNRLTVARGNLYSDVVLFTNFR